jgi:NAD(P)H-quinone oxidoreductase subunit 6
MADIVFLAMMAVTVGGAIVALEAREIVYGAIGLAGSLFGIAAFFFLLDAPYVAVFQITVYVGAVAVLIIFTVMLVRQERWMKEVTYSLGRFVGILTAAAIAASLTLAWSASHLGTVPLQPSQATFVQIGQLISTSFSPALEVLALVLSASVLAAITLAKVERGEEDQR